MKTEMNGEQMKLGFYTEWLRALREVFQLRERERERGGWEGLEFEPCIPSGELHGAAAFPRLNIRPKCNCFVYVREIKQNVTEGLQPYCKTTFKKCFQPNSWNTYIYTERQYLKGSYTKTN